MKKSNRINLNLLKKTKVLKKNLFIMIYYNDFFIIKKRV